MSSSVPAKKLPAQDFSADAEERAQPVHEAVPFPDDSRIQRFDPEGLPSLPEPAACKWDTFCAVDLSQAPTSKHTRLQAYLDERAGRFAWIPTGLHLIEGTLVVRHPMHIIMEPGTELMLSPADSEASAFEGAHAPLLRIEAAGVTVEGGRLAVGKGWRWWETPAFRSVGIQVLAANFELRGTSVRDFDIGFLARGTAGGKAIDGRWRPGVVLDNRIGMQFDYTLGLEPLSGLAPLSDLPGLFREGWVDEHVIIGGNFRFSAAPLARLSPDAHSPAAQGGTFLIVAGRQTNGIKFFGTSFDAGAAMAGKLGAFLGQLNGEGTHFYSCRVVNTWRVWYSGPDETAMEFVEVDAAPLNAPARGNVFLFPMRAQGSGIVAITNTDNTGDQNEYYGHVTWLNDQLFVEQGTTIGEPLEVKEWDSA